MSRGVDFNTLKKQYLPVTLNDENKTKLFIITPTKKVLDDFISMKDSLTAENARDEAIDELYEIVARILSHNKTGVKITKEKVEELLDFEDVIVFIQAYSDFIAEVTGSKN